MATMTALRRTALFAVAAVAVAAVGLRAAQTSQATTMGGYDRETRLAAMRHHFAQVMTVHEAVIRGDLTAVRTPALALARMTPPPGLGPVTSVYFEQLRLAARRAADATSLAAAAQEAAGMLTECGECHRASGVRPEPVIPGKPDLGGVVGHMLEHQRATDGLLLGIVLPSASEWDQGAEHLRAAVLDSGKLPSDPKMTEQIAASDKRVHGLADQARIARSNEERAAVYAQLLGTCAQCHALHGKIWGPNGTW